MLIVFLMKPDNGNAQNGPIATDKVWRTSSRDGINCLYLMLRLHGHTVSYEKLDAALVLRPNQTSLLSLAEVAGSFGVPLAVKRYAPAEMAELPLPLIVHMYNTRQDGGRFVLIYHVPQDESGKFGTIEAGSRALVELSSDEFRRHWSGMLLVPHRSSFRWPIACAFNSFLLAGYCWQRFGQKPV